MLLLYLILVFIFRLHFLFYYFFPLLCDDRMYFGDLSNIIKIKIQAAPQHSKNVLTYLKGYSRAFIAHFCPPKGESGKTYYTQNNAI